MRGRLVGVDVGGTYTKICLIDPDGSVHESFQIPTEPKRSPKEFLSRVAAATRVWNFKGVGLALAGGVETGDGSLLFAPNLKTWIGFPFKRTLERMLRVPVAVENDANAAVWGGYIVALKKKPRHVIGVTLGTGVGGGLILDGRLHRGATGSAGEVGHQTLSPSGPRCHCGRRGCLEAYVGTYGIQRAARRLMRKPPKPLTPKRVADAAKAGDSGALRVWEEVGTWLGLGLANLTLVYNPEAVLLLGGVARAGRLLSDPVRRVFAEQPFREPFASLTLAAPMDRDWGCVGAALLSQLPPKPG
ncbi:MAG TPA: hypothetical protein DCZ01_09420 [Elusimicrobia bacterium]|nr:MAG: hypothetical protein A2X37_07490 [Elusimicrobia bacterium GWA2_66_18]HAZ08720.1 hypothetical protein [Elusimicrobiota bacterium]